MADYTSRIKSWGHKRSEIRAILLAGSKARTNHPGDEWSDFDFEIYTTDYNEYFSKGTFINQFGETWIRLPKQTEDGDPQFLVVFAGGQKVDFTFFPIDLLHQQVARQNLFDSQKRGYEVLIDKDGLAAQLPLPLTGSPIYQRPSAEKFKRTNESFWYSIIYQAKQIRRRNMWVVKQADRIIKDDLYQMLEWHAQATHNWQYETWHGGHFMQEWTEDANWRGLHRVYGHFDPIDSWQALFGSMNLFRKLAQATAQRLTYPYDQKMDDTITSYIQVLYEEDR